MKDPQIEEAITEYAMFQPPSRVMKRLREKYGDNALSYNVVYAIKKKYRKEILDKRKEFEADIPILDAKERWGYLQAIIDGALEEKLVAGKYGTNVVVNYREALAGLKLAHEMTSVKGIVDEESDSQIREIIFGAFDELKKANPKKEHQELVEELLKGLPEEKVKPYLPELLRNE